MVTKRDERLREIVLLALNRVSKKGFRYWDPLLRHLGEPLASKCAESALIGHFGRLFPFFFWVNTELGWQENELWKRADGPNGDPYREFFGSNEILGTLLLIVSGNGLSLRARFFANRIIDDCKKPQQRIAWVINPPTSLD